MTQVFNSKQQYYINNGITAQQILRDKLDDAFFNNIFDEDVIISSLPGMGKTFEMQQRKDNANVLLIQGNGSMPFFTVQVATAVYMAGDNQLTVVLDDCDLLFEDKNINTAKKMFDETKKLKYNKMAKGLKSSCTDIQWEAIEQFQSLDPENPGFDVPLDNVNFIVLSNRLLPSANQVDSYDEGSKKHTVATDLYAIRRRTAYEPIEMDLWDLWGYVANITINEHICEKFMPDITIEQKHQIVNWLFGNWEKVTERNLSVIEKMTKVMVRFQDRYLDVWENKFIEVA